MNLKLGTKKNISRRSFLERSAIALAGISAIGLYSFSNNNKVLHVISFNVRKFYGWPEEKVKDKGMRPGLIAKELAKYSPDVINFSEAPEESFVKQIAEHLNMNYTFFGSAGKNPGAIITPHKIIHSVNAPIVSGNRPEELFTRHWGKAIIEIPNGETIIIHSAHLFPSPNPTAGEIRKREISFIIEAIQKEFENNQNIIVMGDLNHTPEMPEYLQWMDAGFTDSFVAAGKGDGFTFFRYDVPVRIDYILTRGSISENIIESRALSEDAFRTNPSDPNSFALSDHLPQYAKFQLNK